MPKMKFGELQDEFYKETGQVPADKNRDDFGYDEYDEIEEFYKPSKIWEKSGKLKVLGLKKEKYLENYDSSREQTKVAESEAYRLVVQDTKTQDTYVIYLSSHRRAPFYGDGNTSGMLDIKRAKETDFEFTHIPTEEIFLDGFLIEPEEFRYKQELKFQTDENGNIKRSKKGEFLKETDYFDINSINGAPNHYLYRGRFVKNNVFTYSQSSDGQGRGDDEYPRGFVKVNMDLFTPLSRDDKTRKVWVVVAKSDKDVAKLTSQLPGFKIFDGGTTEELPKKIDADVIVLRGGGQYVSEQLTGRIPEQPNVELSYVSAPQIDRFIAKQQAKDPAKHDYMGYVKTPKIRAAFERVEGLIKKNNPDKNKARTQNTGRKMIKKVEHIDTL